MKTICTDCKHQAGCGHTEVDACGNYDAQHWSDAIPTLARIEDDNGTTVYRSEAVDLPTMPRCTCDGLRQALADAAAKGREIARLDAVVEEKQSEERNSAEVIFFKPRGKYYTSETYEFPPELHGNIDIEYPTDQQRAAKLMYDRRVWLQEQLDTTKRTSYRGMHAVSTDSDAIGFPMMVVGGDVS